MSDENIDKIDSIVKTVNATHFGIQRFSSHQDRAAAYFCYIIKDHPVTDGNKRLATLWLEVYTQVYELKIKDRMSLDELAVSIEADKNTDLYDLIELTKKILF
ncbi:MAG: Fic family protein [Candidatus Vogelbacteria bacterium]|nr:Fic family protein [Candidatus Vogelbacteria bacterium]